MIYFSLTTYFFHWRQNGQVGSGSVISLPLGSGSVIQYYGFKDPDLKKIFIDQQHGFFSN